jgi:hypothetical protein
MKQKGFAPVLIILTLAILGVAGFLILKSVSNTKVTSPSPTPISTFSNWKTFKNDSLGFSFKYPADWLSDSSRVFPAPTCPKVRTFENKDCYDGFVSVKTYNLGGSEFKDFVTKLNIEGNRFTDPVVVANEDLPKNLADLNAVAFNYMGMYGVYVAYIPHNNIGIEIRIDGIDSETRDNILSSVVIRK